MPFRMLLLSWQCNFGVVLCYSNLSQKLHIEIDILAAYYVQKSIQEKCIQKGTLEEKVHTKTNERFHSGMDTRTR